MSHPEKSALGLIRAKEITLPPPEGDTCLITAEPRRSRVLYVCQEDGRNELYSVKETSSCVYEIVVLNEGLCSHPNFM